MIDILEEQTVEGISKEDLDTFYRVIDQVKSNVKNMLERHHVKNTWSTGKRVLKASIATPIFMILEVIMEMIIPLMMASIIDNGVEKGDLHHIYVVGAFMVAAAAIGLFAGIMGGKYGAKASAGFARNLRQAMFENIQEYSFSNIDKFSTAGLVTRLTTDVTNLQNAYQMILRMCMRAPSSMIIAMIMSFYINARLASVYLVAIIILGTCLFLIMRSAMKYFDQAFPKYDELNASVQENVSAIRVVKAYVREDHETSKFHKASENIYKIFCKAEENLSFNAPLMQLTVYSCILLISWLGAKMIVGSSLSTGRTDEPSDLLHEHSDEPHDAFDGIRYDHDEPCECAPYYRSSE